SRTSALLFVRRGESVLWRIDLFLTKQIADRQTLGRHLEPGYKILERFREKIVAQIPVKRDAGRSEIMFVEIAPATPDRFVHQSINVVEVNRLHRFQKLKCEMKK